jgi:hypothetical protein
MLVEVMDSVPVFQEILGSNFHFGFENFFFSRGSEEKKVLRLQTEFPAPPVPGTLEHRSPTTRHPIQPPPKRHRTPDLSQP